MPGNFPSALGAATNVRIGLPARGISTNSVVTIMGSSAGILEEQPGGVNMFLLRRAVVS
jgi:hypothetical protein